MFVLFVVVYYFYKPITNLTLLVTFMYMHYTVIFYVIGIFFMNEVLLLL